MNQILQAKQELSMKTLQTNCLMLKALSRQLSIVMLFVLGTFTVNAQVVNSYTQSYITGPQYSVKCNVSGVTSSSNYRWQYKNSFGAWICLVNGNNNINGFNFNCTGAVSNLTATPSNLVFTNPNSSLHGIELKCLISNVQV